MGLSVLGALIALILSLLAQSPQALKRIGLGGSTLDQRARAFTTYAFALMILALGFFLAGVPIGSQPQESAQTDPSPTPTPPTQMEEAMDETAELNPESTAPLTPVTGAFGGPPPDLTRPTTITDSTSITATAPLTGATEAANMPTATPEPAETEEATATSEPTSTPTPTETPLPTLTPTPISGQTAVVDLGGGNLWLHRSPGGQNLIILSSGDVVIILNGRANQGGILWQEVMTVDGIVGWIQAQYLVFDEGE